jgi:hypothetical protein
VHIVSFFLVARSPLFTFANSFSSREGKSSFVPSLL